MAISKAELEDRVAGPALKPRVAWLPWASTEEGSPLSLTLSRIAARPHLVLAAFVLMAVVLNFWETRGQTFYSDEWGRLFFPSSDNESFASLLRWRSGHLVVLHVLLYKGLFGVFGANSYLPFRVVEALLVGTCGLLFYALARARAGPWPSLVATVVLLFLGSAWEVTATPYGTVILLPVAFGLAALACLQHYPRRGDLLACLLLVAAVASHSDGLPFVAGAAVLLVLQSGRGFLTRIWVIGVPAAMYVAWVAWYHLTASGPTPQRVQLHDVGQVPSTILSASAAGLSAISGFFGNSGSANGPPFNLDAGYLLLGLIVIGTIWWVRSGSPLAREVWVPVALALTFWVLLGMVESSKNTSPSVSRYLYPSAVFLLLILLEFTRSIRVTPWVILLGAGALLVSVVPNAINLHEQARRIRAAAVGERVELGALELLRNEVPADSMPYLSRKRNALVVGGNGFRILPVTYLPAFHRYGSPGASPAAIAAMGESQRAAADGVLLKGDDLTLSDLPAGASAARRDCRSTGPDQALSVPSAGLEIRPSRSRSNVTVAARRFATEYQQLSVPPGSGPLLLRPGRSQEIRPWLVEVSGARVCPGPSG